MAVISATWEAEAGECLNPSGGDCSEPRLCHCTPSWAAKAKLHLKKQKQTKNLKYFYYVLNKLIFPFLPFTSRCGEKKKP